MKDIANNHLNTAEEAFRLILTLDAEDAGALNGLGSVSILRCELDLAEEYIRSALEINPEYEAAKQDLARIPAYRDVCNN